MKQLNISIKMSNWGVSVNMLAEMMEQTNNAKKSVLRLYAIAFLIFYIIIINKFPFGPNQAVFIYD
jgi:glucan phosphoethanolaminetransferase (alkaline phosphatase superfamily)